MFYFCSFQERKRLKERFPSLALESNDREQCFVALDQYEVLLENKGVCEGQCKFGKDCPTGEVGVCCSPTINVQTHEPNYLPSCLLYIPSSHNIPSMCKYFIQPNSQIDCFASCDFRLIFHRSICLLFFSYFSHFYSSVHYRFIPLLPSPKYSNAIFTLKGLITRSNVIKSPMKNSCNHLAPSHVY